MVAKLLSENSGNYTRNEESCLIIYAGTIYQRLLRCICKKKYLFKS